jgi:2-polyprenyl-3-methyl-5-hydroxy-6-metoxy-1,4-benzoquinol methylase
MDPRLKKHPIGYWEIENKPTTDELQKYYAEKYYQEGKGSYELAYSQEELSYFSAKLEQRFAVLQRHLKLVEGESRMLDVGCGEGYALAFFRKQGWSVSGIDFSSAGVASKNPDCVDALVVGDIFELLNAEIGAGKNYEVVWLQNVLEHVLDPLGLLNSLRSLVAPGGVAVVTVPNDCSITQRAALVGEHIDHAFWVVPPDHLTYFNSQSLYTTASQTGWSCVDVLGDFPVDWFLFHPGSNYVRDRSVGKAAHKARVQIENFINEQPIDNVIQFWSSAAKLGLGRDITAYLTPVVTE